MMAPSHLDLPQTQPSSSQVVPILCLLGVVALLSSITPTLKYVLQHSGLTFLSIAGGRIIIGFLFLVCITAYQDWRGLRALDVIEGARLGALGLLGVGSYAIAAYGLMYTNVTHYALVYSLLPTFTALFSWCLAREHLSFFSLLGIVLSWTGCLIALGRNFESGTIDLGLGDALVFLFTLMMAAHLVLSMHIVRRHGVLTANTTMFATSAVLVSGCTVAWGEPAPPIHLTWTIWGAVLFIGLGTAIVFLLRCRSLQSMTPATVGAYHNFIPICTIGIAHLSLGEPLTPLTVSGALAVMLGTELVRRAPVLSISSVRNALTPRGSQGCVHLLHKRIDSANPLIPTNRPS